jgi:hypothetical protein
MTLISHVQSVAGEQDPAKDRRHRIERTQLSTQTRSLVQSQLAAACSADFVVLPNLVSNVAAARLEVITRSLPAQRVVCRSSDSSWDEQAVPHTHTLYRLFASSFLKGAVTDLLGGKLRLRDLTCWVSRYRVGEYIAAHTDAGGTLQIVLMLKPVPRGQGGVLKLDLDTGTVEVDLKQGDALLFRATLLTHSTTPLVSTPECSEPSRVVAVGRYFMDGSH